MQRTFDEIHSQEKALLDVLFTGYKANHYRQVQRALKAYRTAGFHVEVKLNTKKDILMGEARRALSNWSTRKRLWEMQQEFYSKRFHRNNEAADFRVQFNDARSAGGYAAAKKLYRKLAMQFHPDLNKTAGAEESMKALNLAWDNFDKVWGCVAA